MPGAAQAQVRVLACDAGGRTVETPHLTPEQAKAAVASFNAGAPKNARLVKTIPDEFAAVFLAQPYASENLTPFQNPNRTDVCFLLREKNAFWTAVENAGFESLQRNEQGIEDRMPLWGRDFVEQASIIGKALELRRASKAMRAILNDIAADDALLSAGITPAASAQLLARKGTLFASADAR
jgi:hypothetical protein